MNTDVWERDRTPQPALNSWPKVWVNIKAMLKRKSQRASQHLVFSCLCCTFLLLQVAPGEVRHLHTQLQFIIAALQQVGVMKGCIKRWEGQWWKPQIWYWNGFFFNQHHRQKFSCCPFPYFHPDVKGPHSENRKSEIPSSLRHVQCLVLSFRHPASRGPWTDTLRKWTL